MLTAFDFVALWVGRIWCVGILLVLALLVVDTLRGE